MLEEIGIELVNQAKKNKLDPIIGRTKEIKRTVEILLRRKKNNPILIGPAGVGKTAIVEGIANLIATDDCPSFLKDKKIIALNIFELVSGTKYRGEFEEKMKHLIKELEQKGFTYADWNVDTLDSYCKNDPSKISQNALKAVNKNEKNNHYYQTILLHDDINKPATIQALPTLIEKLIAKGYNFEPLTKNSTIIKHKLK